MVATMDLPDVGDALAVEVLGLVELGLFSQETRQIVEGLADEWVVRPEAAVADVQSLAKERFGLVDPLLHPEEHPQVVERLGDQRIARRVDLAPELEGFAEERLGAGEVADLGAQNREVDQGRGQVDPPVVRGLAQDRYRVAVERNRLLEPAGLAQQAGEVVEALRDVGVASG